MTTVDKSTKNYSTFDPRYIPDCALWLDGSDRNRMTFSPAGSNNIASITDKSFNGYSITPTSGTVTAVPAGQNGRNYIQLGTKILQIINFAWRTNFTIFFALRVANSNFITTQQTSGGTYLNYVFTQNDGLMIVGTTSTLFYDTINGSTTSGVSVIPANSWCIFSIGYNNGTVGTNYAVNGTIRFTTPQPTIAADSVITENLYINGTRGGGLTSTTDIGDMLFYRRNITSTERQQIEGYLAWKWGLQSNLPTSPAHPYRSAIGRGPFLQAFDPTAMGTCVLWLDASDTRYFTIDGSSNILTLTDKKGVSGSGTKYGTPTWSSTGLDGVRPAFGTNAGAFVFTLGTALTTFANTTFIVAKLDSAPSDGSCAVGFSTDSTGASSFYKCLEYTSSRFRINMNFGTSYVNSGTIGPVVSSSFLYSSTYNGSTGTPALRNYLKAGTQSDSVNVSTNPASGNGSHCMVGCDSVTFTGGTTPTNYWQNGKIAEILVFNSVLTDSFRQFIDSYLSYKWGLQADIPASSTYKAYYPLTVV
jgi:hypothetical protein